MTEDDVRRIVREELVAINAAVEKAGEMYDERMRARLKDVPRKQPV